DTNGAANNITGTNLTASAVTGIDLDTTITTVTSANVTGTGAIDINDLAGGLVVTSATTNDGAITLNATGGDLTLTTVTAGGTDRTITATTTTSGNINVGVLTALLDTVTLSAAAAITDGNGAANNVSATNLLLRATTGIGSGTGTTATDPLETTVTNLDARNTTSGGIYLVNTGPLTIKDLDAPADGSG